MRIDFPKPDASSAGAPDQAITALIIDGSTISVEGLFDTAEFWMAEVVLTPEQLAAIHEATR